MDYKLAKQLKDAGFPQNSAGAFIFKDNIPKKEPVLVPILSKLIEACGDRFFRLVNFNGDSDATWQSEAHNFEGHGQGKTPEEAVAKLWLKLNKK